MRHITSVLALCAALFTPAAFATDHSGHWWNPAESGWGIAVQQQQDRLFFQLYTYDDDHKPTWYVGSCKLDGNICPATLYAAKGGLPLPYYMTPTIEPAGQSTLIFHAPDTASFSYKIGNHTAWTTGVVKMVF